MKVLNCAIATYNTSSMGSRCHLTIGKNSVFLNKDYALDWNDQIEATIKALGYVIIGLVKIGEKDIILLE